MKKNQKIFRVTLFVCVACFLIGLMGIFGAQPAKASGSFSSFKINDGAEVRMAYNEDDTNNYDESGLRYNISISANDYDTIKGLDANAKFGILIAPIDYHTANNLNKANVFGIGGNAKYYWATKDVDGTWKDFDGDKTDKKEIINLSTTKMVYDKDENVYRFYGSIVNINDGNEGREFIGVGYVQYDSNVEMVYGDTQRSMAYVAQMAHADLENDLTDDDRTFLYDSYIKGITSSATVNHYKMNIDGTYDLIEEDAKTTDTIQIGETVSADANTYDGYVFNEAISKAEGTLYANGRTELSFYYHKENLGLIDKNTVTSFDYQTAFPDANSYALKKVIWDDEAHTGQIEIPSDYALAEKDMTKEYKVAVTLNDYITDGKLDLTNLDGVYEIQAAYGSGESRVVVTTKFDVYDATETEIVWNDASTALDYARVYAWNGKAKDLGGQKEVVALTDEGHTGDYIKMDYIGSGTKTHPKIGGFSVLSVHSYEYYEQALKNNPTYTLSFNFKVKGVSLDGQTIVGLHGSDGNRNMVYLNGIENTLDADKHPAGEIQPDTWYSAEIPLETLLKNWDNMRHKSNDSITNTNVARNWNKLIFWDTQSVDSQGNAFDYAANLASFDVWVGDIVLAPTVTAETLNLNLDNLASEASQYNFYYSGNAQTPTNYANDTYSGAPFNVHGLAPYIYTNDPRNRCDSVEAIFSGSTYSKNGVEKVVNFAFKRVEVLNEDGTVATLNKHMLMAVDLSELTLDVLKFLKASGYSKLTYSIVADVNYTTNQSGNSTARVTPGTIDFEYLKNNPNKTVYREKADGSLSTNINMAAFSYDTTNSVHPVYWMTVEYSLDNLIACYDQVFVGSHFILGVPYSRYSFARNASTGEIDPSFYLSPIQIVK